MTCIVALKTNGGRILMGADSAGVCAGYAFHSRNDPKIYRVGGMLIGFTTSFRMGQLLGYSLSLPAKHDDVSVEKYMATEFIDAVRNCLKTGGWAKKNSEEESGGNFLVAYRGRIFQIFDDYQVSERMEQYDATGCGFELALGSLYTSEGLIDNPEIRVRTALQAASSFSAGVSSPFLIKELEALALV